MMYQDELAEIECSECRGAGFFGNGPVADACDVCEGKGVIVTDEPLSSITAAEPDVEARFRLGPMATPGEDREEAA